MGWQITVSNAAAHQGGILALLPSLLPSVLAGVAALGGVYVGGREQRKAAFEAAKRQREERLDDRRAQQDAEEARLSGEQAFAKLLIAHHLEAYAKACAGVVAYNSDPVEHRPEDDAQAVPAFPDWPDVPWELLGAKETGAARDIEARVDLRMAWVKGDIEMMATDASDAREFYSDGAAKIGLESWRVAERLRKEAGVVPFAFPNDGWNYAETLIDYVERMDRERRERREEREKKDREKFEALARAKASSASD